MENVEEGRVSVRSYAGYSPNVRAKAQRWLRLQWERGHLPRPSLCHACGLERGIIDAHAEDYSEPFLPGKTDAYHLCYVCHLMVHVRNRHPKAWLLYCNAVGSGWRPEPMLKRDISRFTSRYLRLEFLPVISHPQRASTVLDEIDAGKLA